MESRPQIREGVQRLKCVFLEIPGTRLTPLDAAKLSGLDGAVCEVVLEALEDARFLKRDGSGRYLCRATDSPYS
jgi:hypothetical protein